jgi:hypothetical protein
MTKPRVGYHTAILQLPSRLWERLCNEADEKGISTTRLVTRILAKQLHIAEETLPRPKRAGRKPLALPAVKSDADATGLYLESLRLDNPQLEAVRPGTREADAADVAKAKWKKG